MGNTGSVTLTKPFDVAIGVIRDQDQEVFPAADLLSSDLVLQPGEYAVWSSSFCTTIQVVKVPGQTYRLFVLADPTESLAESDESNNVSFTDPFEL